MNTFVVYFVLALFCIAAQAVLLAVGGFGLSLLVDKSMRMAYAVTFKIVYLSIALMLYTTNVVLWAILLGGL